MTALYQLHEEHCEEAAEKAFRMYRNEFRRLGPKALVNAVRKYGTMGTRVERRLLRLDGIRRQKT